MKHKQDILREEIAQQTKEFLEKGGKIYVDKTDPIPPNHKANLRYLTGDLSARIQGSHT